MFQHAGSNHIRSAVVTIAVVLRHGVASKLLPTVSLVPSAALPALHPQLFVSAQHVRNIIYYDIMCYHSRA